MENTQIRDQLIVGLKSAEIRPELLKESKLTLSEAITKAVALETSQIDSRLFREDAATMMQTPPIAAVAEDRPKAKRKAPSSASKHCGRTHAQGKQFCPAAHVRCHDCGKVGHFSAVCLSHKGQSGANAVEDADGEAANVGYDSNYAWSEKAARDSFTITLLVNGKPCEGLMDTGATRTIITDDIVQATEPSKRTTAE